METLICWDLHWLPSNRSVEYKILVLVYKALNGTGPENIHELLTVKKSVWDLRSVHNVVSLKAPRTKLVTGGDSSFKKAATCLWNCTPVSLRNTYLNLALTDIYVPSLIPKRCILCSYIRLLTDCVMHWWAALSGIWGHNKCWYYYYSPYWRYQLTSFSARIISSICFT